MQIRTDPALTAIVRLTRLSALAVAAFMSVSCSNRDTWLKPDRSAKNATARTLRLYTSLSVSSLNPLLLSDDALQLSYFIYDTLVVSDSKHRLHPSLAEIVPSRANGGISPDGKTIRFKLRRDVFWHDGRPFTSSDVAFTLAAIANPKVNIWSRHGYDLIVTVKTPDRYTVVVTLKERFAPSVYVIGTHYPIMPRHLLANSPNLNRDPIGAKPVGTGPYRFKRWIHGVRIDFAANDAYFAGAPAIRNISVAEIPNDNSVALQLRDHQIDFGIVDSHMYARLRSVRDLNTATEPLNDVVGYAFNTARPILSDVRVRRALFMAIDRASIVAKGTFGTGTIAYADLPASLWTQREPPNPYGYDPERASALLDAAGWKRGPSGTRVKGGATLELRAINVRSPGAESMDLQMQQMLRLIGVGWSNKYFDATTYYESKANGGPVAAGDFDMAGFQWSGGGDPENDRIFTCANRIPDGGNAASYCSRRMDDLQRDSLTTLSAVRRAADVVEIERLAATELPYAFLYHTPYRFVWDPALRRTPASAENVWYDVRRWSFSTSPN